MKKYENYKSISELWLPSIPIHWMPKKIKYLFSERSEKGYPGEPLLVASQNMGVVPKDVYGNRTVEAMKDLQLLKLVRLGDFVISLRSFQGGIEYAYYQGIISPAYTVMTPKDEMTAGYFRYLAKSRLFIELLQLCVTGIREGQNVDYSKLKNHQIPLPLREEQDQIVRYLDWKISRINMLISKKNKEIVLLKEQRKAVIDEGILHGFTSTKTKNSGVSWLGNIPAHWCVKPLKRVCRLNESISHLVGKLNGDTKVTFLPMENVSSTGDIDCSIKKSLSEVRLGFSSFAKGDVVVAKITPCFENGKGACLDTLDTDVGFGTTEFINLRPSSEIVSRYLYLITMTRPFRKLGEKVMTGSSGQKRVSSNFIKNFAVGIPPVNEQKDIIKEIDRRLYQIDKLMRCKKTSIRTLCELRTRLISDVVTGQMDVRGIEIPDFEMVEEPDAQETFNEDAPAEEAEEQEG